MENFVVSARKYRPATFDTVVGQSHITTTLKNAIANNHLAQAFLFCGPRGVGKTTCARILAKTINCQNLTPETEACGECESCQAFQKNASLNIHELDAASNNSVEDIRNLVDQVRYPPQTGKYKIYIIDEVHMLSNSAFNAFLKTLEEPPSYAIFILATTEKHKIIPTILSRCQIFDFNRIQVQDIAKHLANIATKEEIKAEAEALHLIAQKADGGLRDALSMFDLIVTFSSDNTISYAKAIDNLHILDYDYYFRMVDVLLEENVAKSLLIFNEILKKGFDGHQFIVGLCEHCRNLLVMKDPQTVELLEVSENVKQKYIQQAQQSNMSFLMSVISIASQCDINYKQSKNQRLHVELALMKMAYVNSAINLAKIAQTEGVKKKADDVTTNGHKEPVGQIIKKKEFKSTLKIPTTTVLEKSVKNYATKTVVKEDKIEEVVETNRNQAFTPEQLQTCWKELVELKKGDIREHVILNQEPELKEGNIVHLKLTNSIQMNNFNSLKGEWQKFLRNGLQNDQIQLQAEVVTQIPQNMIYTARDRFEFLAKKHQILLEFRNRFGLDIDG